MRLMFAFGVSFELPVLLLLLVKAGLMTADGLPRNANMQFCWPLLRPLF